MVQATKLIALLRGDAFKNFLGYHHQLLWSRVQPKAESKTTDSIPTRIRGRTRELQHYFALEISFAAILLFQNTVSCNLKATGTPPLLSRGSMSK